MMRAITLLEQEPHSPTFYPTAKTDAGSVHGKSPHEDMGDYPQTDLISSASLSTISRTVLLSFQSAFHLSITLLVRYRSLASI